MNTELITITSISLIAVIFTVTILIFSFMRKKRLLEVSKERMNINKYSISIDIYKRKFDLYEVDPNGTMSTEEVNVIKDIPLFKLIDLSDQYSKNAFIFKLINKIQWEGNIKEIVDLIKKNIGKSDKVRHNRKKIVFLTIASWDTKERRLYLNWQSIDMNMEILTELEEEQVFETETNLAKKISNLAIKYKKPVLVKIKASDSYTHISDPTFPPDEIIKIVNYHISKKYVTSLTGRNNIYMLIESSKFSKDIDSEVRKIVEKEIKYSRLFSRNISNKFNALEYSYSLIKFNKNVSYESSIMNSMILTKIMSNNDSDFISNLNPIIDSEYESAYKIIEKKMKEAFEYLSNYNLNYFDDIAYKHTVVSPAIPNSVQYFINEYSVGLKEEFINLMLEDVKNVKSMNISNPIFMIHWRFLYDILLSGKKIDIPVLVYMNDDSIDLLSLSFLEMIENTNSSKQKIMLLMKDISPYYEQIVKKGKFQALVISPQVSILIKKDISFELTLEYIKKLSQDKGAKIIEFK